MKIDFFFAALAASILRRKINATVVSCTDIVVADSVVADSTPTWEGAGFGGATEEGGIVGGILSDCVESLCIWYIEHGASGIRKSCENVDCLEQIVILREKEKKIEMRMIEKFEMTAQI
jgi:hypothetical protein